MSSITMTGWRTGPQTVSLIELVKQYSTGSLIGAKSEIERLLAGESVKLEFDSDARKEEFKKKAESLGAILSW